MKIGKYITNFSVLGSAASAVGVVKQTKQMPSDWRRYLIWGIWLLGLVLAVARVAKQQEDYDYEKQ